MDKIHPPSPPDVSNSPPIRQQISKRTDGGLERIIRGIPGLRPFRDSNEQGSLTPMSLMQGPALESGETEARGQEESGE